MMNSVEMWFSDSSSEEEDTNHLRRYRRNLRDASNPLDYDTNKFIQNFRLSKEAFMQLLHEVQSKLHSGSRAQSVPVITKLVATLRFFAQGSYQLGVGNEGFVGVAQPTFSLMLTDVLNALESTICPKYISFQYTDAETSAAKMFFFEKSGIPGIIGAIDGTHIKIAALMKNQQHLYNCRKGYYSINAIIVCDHNMEIRYINAKYPGSSHDSYVFNMSRLKSHLEAEHMNGMQNAWLIGDSGYPLLPYLLTPYRNTNPGSIEERFNKRHVLARGIIERTIGVLKSRFRCLLGVRALHYSPEKISQIINVCASLHNICRRFNVQEPREPDDTPEAENVVESHELEMDSEHQENFNNCSLVAPNLDAQVLRNEIAMSIL